MLAWFQQPTNFKATSGGLPGGAIGPIVILTRPGSDNTIILTNAAGAILVRITPAVNPVPPFGP